MIEAAKISSAAQPNSVDISAQVALRLNVAFQQNLVPAIAEIKIDNGTGVDLRDITISVSSEPAFVHPKTFRFDFLQAGASRQIKPVPVDLDAAFLLGLKDPTLGHINIIVRAADAELARHSYPCELHPPSEWTGLAPTPELVAAYVRPADPALEAVLRKAGAKLLEAGRSGLMDGYQVKNKGRTWELAEAIFTSLAEEGFVYSIAPPNFEKNGQRVATPAAMLERKVCTSLELALLMAACLEQAGLDPMLGFSEGHAFCGVWLHATAGASEVVRDAQMLRDKIAAHDLILIESTMLTNLPRVRFRTAVAKAGLLVAENADKPFDLVIDVRGARNRQIRPLGTVAHLQSAAKTAKSFSRLPTSTGDASISKEPGRLERWKRNLLDLSPRNRNLNLVAGEDALLLLNDAAFVEQYLLAGKKCLFAPKSSAKKTTVADAFLASGSAKELDEKLTTIARDARISMEELATNSLYLTIGLVGWTPHKSSISYQAPLLLLPVALERIAGRFNLARCEGDARINPVLLHLLKREFGLLMPEFDGALPQCATSEDIDVVLATAGSYLANVKGFGLTPDVMLTNLWVERFLMWKDIAEQGENLQRNRLLNHLIETPKDSYGNAADLPDARKIDAVIEPFNLFMPLPADTSQTAAVVAAAYGKDFVLSGPPGTGKSQTIANMIVQLLGDGKTVLLVSQKAAALEAAHQRLTSIGLGGYCLEVHSGKAQTPAVVAQLAKAWDMRATPTPKEWYLAAADLKKLRERLNGVVGALHHRHRNGLVAHGAIGLILRDQAFAAGVELAFDDPDLHDEVDMRRLRGRCRELQTALDAIGNPLHHVLGLIGRAHWSPVWQKELLEAAAQFREAALRLTRGCHHAASLFGVPTSGNPRRILNLLTVLGQVIMPVALDAKPLLGPESASLHQAITKWRALKERHDGLAAKLAGPYRDAVYDLDLAALLDNWRKASTRLMLVARHKKLVSDTLAAFTDAPVLADTGAEIARLIELKAIRIEAADLDGVLAALGPAWQGLKTNAEQIAPLLAWEDVTRARIETLASPEYPASFWIEALLAALRDQADQLKEKGAIRNAIAHLLKDYRSFEHARDKLVSLAEPSDDDLGLPLNDDWLMSATSSVGAWSNAAREIQRWCHWREVAAISTELGLGPLIVALQKGQISAAEIPAAFELAYARWWVMQVVDRAPMLRGFVAEQHQDAIARFVRLDEKVASLAQQVVLGRLSGDVPPHSAYGKDPEFGILADEIDHPTAMALRQLLAQIPTVISRLSPCMMMSPSAVAQFLPSDIKPFDVVIFDEASQIAASDAVGAIARATQVVVVGDQQQLPALTHAGRGFAGDTDHPARVASILDECLNANLPVKTLNWHYRSKYESLITYSNQHNYDGRLVTFPSPITQDRALKLVQVPKAADAGRKLAEAVVKQAVQRLSDPSFALRKSSLGVVVTGRQQQQLIEGLLEQAAGTQPQLRAYFDTSWPEPLFVKTIENVQGDERDVILLALDFANEATSALVSDGGEQLLNVATTRARSELVVFSNFETASVGVAQPASPAAQNLHRFLKFADQRSDPPSQPPSNESDAETPFEDVVRHALETHGWSVSARLGASPVKIDLAVVDPDAPERYLAAIECDGATYNLALNPRERDRLRTKILRARGWQVHRVWAIDWWVDADRAIARLQAALEADRAKARLPMDEQAFEWGAAADDAGAEEIEAEEIEAADEAALDALIPQTAQVLSMSAVAPPPIRPYVITDLQSLGLNADRNAFHEGAYRATLAVMVDRVISTEGPLFDEVLLRRIARAHRFARVTARIREAVLDAIAPDIQRTTEKGATIFWPRGCDTTKLTGFRAASASERDILDIPLVELAGLAEYLLATGMKHEQMALAIGHHAGLDRLKEGAQVRIDQAIYMAQQRSR